MGSPDLTIEKPSLVAGALGITEKNVTHNLYNKFPWVRANGAGTKPILLEFFAYFRAATAVKKLPEAMRLEPTLERIYELDASVPPGTVSPAINYDMIIPAKTAGAYLAAAQNREQGQWPFNNSGRAVFLYHPDDAEFCEQVAQAGEAKVYHAIKSRVGTLKEMKMKEIRVFFPFEGEFVLAINTPSAGQTAAWAKTHEQLEQFTKR